MRLADDWHYKMLAMALEGDGSKGRLRAQSKRRSSKFRGVPIGLGQSGRGDVADLLFNDKPTPKGAQNSRPLALKVFQARSSLRLALAEPPRFRRNQYRSL